MTDTITTKPGHQHGPSIKAPRVYEALRREGYDKSAAAAISNAQRKKRPRYQAKDVAPTATNAPAHGPGGLMSAPGMGGAMPKRKKRMPLNAKPCDTCPLATTKGEPIAPGITRIRGNLCNVHGRYGKCPGAPKGAKPKKGRAPAKGRDAAVAARQALRDQQREQDRAERASRQQQRDTEHAQERANRVRRQAEIEADRQERLARERRHEAQREQDRAARQNKPKGGGGKKRKPEAAAPTPKPPRARRPAPVRTVNQGAQIARQGQQQRDRAARERAQQARERERQQRQAEQGRVTTAELADAARKLQAGEKLTTEEEDGLVRNGLARRPKAGGLILTVQGQRATRQKDKAMIETKASGSPGDYLVVEDPKQSSKWHLQVRTNGKPDHRLMGAAWAALHGGYRGNTYQGPNRSQAISKLRKLYASEGMDIPGEKSSSSFTVFKQADGHYRWLGCTTNAYLDRDGEIISTKTLEADVARADADGQYGPLRWWHVGEPDPFNVTAPWGPGLDLGVCDFNAMSGRMLIESGTFKDDVIGAMVAANVSAFQFSPGFFHPLTDPDGAGVYHHIRRFERSLVPAGRAANPYTWLTVAKGQPNMLEEKVKQLKHLLGGTPEAETAVDAVVSEAGMAQKELDTQGIAYKDAPDWAQALVGEITTLKAEIAALKAPADAGPDGGMMGGGAMDAEDMMDQGVDENVEPDGGGDGLTLSPEDISAIGQAVGQAVSAVLAGALQPLVATMDLSNKMGAGVQEIKTMLGAYQTQKDAKDAEQAQQLAVLQASVKALEGDLPRGVADVYRASMAPDTVMTKGEAEAILNVAPAGPFDDLFRNLFGGTPIGNGVNPQIN